MAGERGALGELKFEVRRDHHLVRQKILDWFPVVAEEEHELWYDLPGVEAAQDVPDPAQHQPEDRENFLTTTESIIFRAGAKDRLASQLVSWFPRSYCYVEPFAATYKILFAKPWRDQIEVVNDYDADLVEFWRWCRHDPDRLYETILDTPVHEGIIFGLRQQLGEGKLRGVHRAAAWFIASQTTFNGKVDLTSLGITARAGIRLVIDRARMTGVQKRLRGVTLLSTDFARVIRIMNKALDRHFVFFYLDPPYWMTQGYKYMNGGGGFSWTQQVQLADLCRDIDEVGNKFIQTNSYHPDLLKLYGEYKRADGTPRFYLKEVGVRYTIGGKVNEINSELIVSNFPLVDTQVAQQTLLRLT